MAEASRTRRLLLFVFLLASLMEAIIQLFLEISPYDFLFNSEVENMPGLQRFQKPDYCIQDKAHRNSIVLLTILMAGLPFSHDLAAEVLLGNRLSTGSLQFASCCVYKIP